jgi:hypothetical protein
MCLSVLPSPNLLSYIHSLGLHTSEVFAHHSFVACGFASSGVRTLQIRFLFKCFNVLESEAALEPVLMFTAIGFTSSQNLNLLLTSLC